MIAIIVDLLLGLTQIGKIIGMTIHGILWMISWVYHIPSMDYSQQQTQPTNTILSIGHDKLKYYNISQTNMDKIIITSTILIIICISICVYNPCANSILTLSLMLGTSIYTFTKTFFILIYTGSMIIIIITFIIIIFNFGIIICIFRKLRIAWTKIFIKQKPNEYAFELDTPLKKIIAYYYTKKSQRNSLIKSVKLSKQEIDLINDDRKLNKIPSVNHDNTLVKTIKIIKHSIIIPFLQCICTKCYCKYCIETIFTIQTYEQQKIQYITPNPTRQYDQITVSDTRPNALERLRRQNNIRNTDGVKRTLSFTPNDRNKYTITPISTLSTTNISPITPILTKKRTELNIFNRTRIQHNSTKPKPITTKKKKRSIINTKTEYIKRINNISKWFTY